MGKNGDDDGVKDGDKHGKKKHDRGGELVSHLCWAEKKSVKHTSQLIAVPAAKCGHICFVECKAKKTPWLQCNHILIRNPWGSLFCLQWAWLQLLRRIKQKITFGATQTALLCLVIFINCSFDDRQHLRGGQKPCNHNLVSIWEWCMGVSYMRIILLMEQPLIPWVREVIMLICNLQNSCSKRSGFNHSAHDIANTVCLCVYRTQYPWKNNIYYNMLMNWGNAGT